MSDQNEQEELIIVPSERISSEALEALIHEYILREGTDYGHSEMSLQEKYNKVRGQLEKGHIVITFSTTTESTSLMTKNQIGLLQSKQ